MTDTYHKTCIGVIIMIISIIAIIIIIIIIVLVLVVALVLLLLLLLLAFSELANQPADTSVHRNISGLVVEHRVSTEVTFGRGDLSVCPLRGFTGAQECLTFNRRVVPQGSPQGQTLKASLGALLCLSENTSRGNILHTRNQHLRNRGISVAYSNGLSLAFSKELSLAQWIVTGIVRWTFSGIFQWMFFFARSVFCSMLP